MEDKDSENPLEELLRSLLGPEAAKEIASQMESSGLNPGAMMGSFGPGAMMSLQHLFSNDSGPVNWRLAEDMARQDAYQSGDPQLTAAQEEQVKQALAVADLWLDPVTDFVNKSVKRSAWTRVGWVDGTLAEWKSVCDPVASNASRALTEAIGEELDHGDLGIPPEMAGLASTLRQGMPRMSGMVFGGQVGKALGAMSTEAFGTSDSGIPLTDGTVSALVLTNIEQFGEGLDIPSDEVLQYLAVRECAHGRLFASVPWLRTDLLQAIQTYSSEIAIDLSAIEEAARGIDPSNLESFQEVMAGDVFSAKPTERQLRALTRLETMLALIEGWVETVTTQATAPYLPHATQLREMVRRRRISGSAGDQILAQLVGLHLRPRAARSAAELFRLAEGERDALWSHPDRLPDAEQLNNPAEFIAGPTDEADEMDQALEQLLDGTLGWADGLEPDD